MKSTKKVKGYLLRFFVILILMLYHSCSYLPEEKGAHLNLKEETAWVEWWHPLSFIRT